MTIFIDGCTMTQPKHQDAVKATVKKLMAEDAKNNPLIPDAIESRIYTYAIKGAILGVNMGLGWLTSRTPFMGLLARWAKKSP